jgi:TolB-like protein/Tfp pilus assembly protein PilF
VNIASRLQTLAPIGGIWISDSVYNNVSNKKDINTKFVRTEILKNVKEPVRIYEVIINNEKEQPVISKAAIKNVHPEKSIAVLPFANMSNDPEQDYFSEGMAEEIINSLAHLKDLKVAGRTSSSQYKGVKADLREVGRRLGVNTVLEGSVRKQGTRIRITAQLINVEDGFHFWSDKYDRELDDVFAIQDEIALAITEQLKIRLLDEDREKITKISTRNAEAYELYLKGRFNINRRGKFILTGLQFFQQAIAVDPGYGLAYSGISVAHLLTAFYSFFPGKEKMNEVKQAAEMAIQLDNSLSDPYFVLGAYYVYFEWNWVEAKKNKLKAIELDPKNAQAHSLYGMNYLAWVEGKFDEAEVYCRMGIKLEPLSAIDHADAAWVLYTANRFEEALEYAKSGIELDNNSFLSHRLAGLCNMQLQHYDEAVNTLQYLIHISNRHQHAVASLIWVYCSKGNFNEARILMNELEKRSATEYIAGTYAGLSAGYLGDANSAFHYLEKAYNDRDPVLITVKYAPCVPALIRNDPRFQNLLDRIGFPNT